MSTYSTLVYTDNTEANIFIKALYIKFLKPSDDGEKLILSNVLRKYNGSVWIINIGSTTRPNEGYTFEISSEKSYTDRFNTSTDPNVNARLNIYAIVDWKVIPEENNPTIYEANILNEAYIKELFPKVLPRTIGTLEMVDDSISEIKIKDSSISNSKLKDRSITHNKLTNGIVQKNNLYKEYVNLSIPPLNLLPCDYWCNNVHSGDLVKTIYHQYEKNGYIFKINNDVKKYVVKGIVKDNLAYNERASFGCYNDIPSVDSYIDLTVLDLTNNTFEILEGTQYIFITIKENLNLKNVL